MSEAPTPPELPAPKRSRLRFLRIAISVFFGLLTVALCVLWVQSYWLKLYTEARYHRLQLMASTLPGILGVNLDTNQTSSGPGTPPPTYWRSAAFPPGPRTYGLKTKGLKVTSLLGFRYVSSNNIYEADVPFWMLTFLTAATPLMLWIHRARRFSLRTLLLATTLLAVVLGCVVWMLK